MFKKILLGLVVVVAIIVLLASRKPDAYAVERIATIKAPPEKLVPLIADFHQWKQWSPYEKKDSTMKTTFSGPPMGKGAIYEWAGNSQVGEGRMEVLTVEPTKVTIKLDFLKPFEGHNTALFTLTPIGDATEVKWAMTGPAPFVSKVMMVFMNMDSMIGDDFAIGLASLKALAEKPKTDG